jgi:hypothetical protein
VLVVWLCAAFDLDGRDPARRGVSVSPAQFDVRPNGARSGRGDVLLVRLIQAPDPDVLLFSLVGDSVGVEESRVEPKLVSRAIIHSAQLVLQNASEQLFLSWPFLKDRL